MRRDIWLKQRKTGIGASEAAAIFGVHPYLSAIEVYAQKIALFTEDRPMSELQEWGLRHEAAIANAYQEKTGRKIITLNQDEVNGGPLWIDRHPEHPFILSTPDAKILVPERGGQKGLEIKTSDGYAFKKWLDGLPLHYKIQVQQQLAVSGDDMSGFAVLHGGNRFHQEDIERNDAFINDALIPKLYDFWHNHVLKRIPPPADGSASSFRALAMLYPEDSGETIELTDQHDKFHIERKEKKAEIKRLESRVRELDAKFKEDIGAASEAILPSGIRYTLRVQERPGHTVGPSKGRTLRDHRR